MCNIAGYIGSKKATPILFEMIKKQEGYAGGYYAGIATIKDNKILSHKLTGSIDMLENTFAKDFDFVKLDTVSEALLSDVSKVLAGEDRLYVLPVMDARVFIFTKEGKYVNSLRMGQGPGEVRCVYDMKVHDGFLYAFDNFRTIRKYDKDGNYIEDVYTRNDYNLLMEFEQNQLGEGIYYDVDCWTRTWGGSPQTDPVWITKTRVRRLSNYLVRFGFAFNLSANFSGNIKIVSRLSVVAPRIKTETDKSDATLGVSDYEKFMNITYGNTAAYYSIENL